MDSKKEVRIIKATMSQPNRTKIRVAAYCRVSTDSDDQSNSFITQVKYYNDFISSSTNMELVDIYADEGITGTSIKKREEFKRMLRDSKMGKLDRIYVKSVSRFARNSLECIENIRLLKSYGTSVFFENDGIDTDTMNSEMILYIKSAFAQSEALACSKRITTAFRMKMENGSFVTPCAPFGYELVDKHLSIIPKQAKIVRHIFDLYISGMGVQKIILDLNKTANEYAPWKKDHIRYILSNEKYIGDSLWQKNYTPYALPLQITKNKGEAEKYYAENTHEAIIDDLSFQKAQKRMKSGAEKVSNRSERVKRKYTNILYCGCCGWAYKFCRLKGYERWVCSKKGSAECDCQSMPITETEIENTFVNFYNKLRQNQELILDKTLQMLIFAKKIISTGNESIVEIDKEVSILSNESNMYLHLYNQGILDVITFREQTEIIKNKVFALKNRRQKIMDDDAEESEIESISKIKKIIAEMPESILWFDINIFQAIVDKVYVLKDGELRFELKCGLNLKEKIEWD